VNIDGEEKLLFMIRQKSGEKFVLQSFLTVPLEILKEKGAVQSMLSGD
jgi:hypothetical protein